jgi:hypothetical protein
LSEPHLPLPPADLSSRRLPISTLKAGTALFRSHAIDKRPIWFGPGPGRPPEYRFDAPGGEYGVCYVGRRDMAAFVETYFRDLPVRVVSRADLALRAISSLTLARSLRVVRLYGPGLVKTGATSAVGGAKLIVPTGFAGQPCAHSQAWSLALHDHPSSPDGLQYRSSHDDQLMCVALFDRSASAVRVKAIGEPLSEMKRFLALAIKRYSIALL